MVKIRVIYILLDWYAYFRSIGFRILIRNLGLPVCGLRSCFREQAQTIMLILFVLW